MENCLNENVVLVEAPKFARVLDESGILRLRDWAGNLNRRVLDAVQTPRLIIDIVFLQSMEKKNWLWKRQVEKYKKSSELLDFFTAFPSPTFPPSPGICRPLRLPRLRAVQTLKNFDIGDGHVDKPFYL